MRFAWYLIIFTFIISLNTSAQADSKTGFPLIYKQDFEEREAIHGFVFSDPAPWFLTSGKDGGLALEYAGRGDYEPRVRSPLIIGLIDNLVLGDFILEADVLQTGSEYGHRDMYFDDMETPIMVANDKTFKVGYVGFGSSDDSGKVDNIRIWARESRKKKSVIFMKKY